MKLDLVSMSVPELLDTYRAILRELRRRDVVRTANAPAGDFAEQLVAKALRGQLAPNSQRGYDLRTPDGRRIQVKCRVLDETRKNPRRKLSPFKSFDFDDAVIVLLNSDYTVHRGVLVPVAVVKRVAKKRANGHVADARSALLDAPENTDLTKRLKKTNGEAPATAGAS